MLYCRHMNSKIAIIIFVLTVFPTITCMELAASNKKPHQKAKGKVHRIRKDEKVIDVCPGVGTTITVVKAKIRDLEDSNEVVGFVKMGDIIFVTGRKINGGWFPIKTTTGKRGLISAKILEPRACVQEWRPINELEILTK